MKGTIGGAVALAVMAAALQASDASARECRRAQALSTGAPRPLDARTQAAIQEALRDEVRSKAEYDSAIERGAGMPFLRIVQAEERHAELLRSLFRARQLAVPQMEAPLADESAAAPPAAACVRAVASEAANVALYDRLLASEALPPDVRAVFEHNRSASLEHHTPAFRRCAGSASPHDGRGRTCCSDGACPHGGCRSGRQQRGRATHSEGRR